MKILLEVFKARLDLEPDLVEGVLSLGKEVGMRCCLMVPFNSKRSMIL